MVVTLFIFGFCRNHGHVRNALSPSTLQQFDIYSSVVI
jgi:hypothetical protein